MFLIEYCLDERMLCGRKLLSISGSHCSSWGASQVFLTQSKKYINPSDFKLEWRIIEGGGERDVAGGGELEVCNEVEIDIGI